jgi:hypothetical protein
MIATTAYPIIPSPAAAPIAPSIVLSFIGLF